MYSDWFNGIDILQGRWRHVEKVGYCYPSGLEKTLCMVKVKCTLVQALRLYTGRTAHMESRGIALLFYDHDTRMG
jgi:hypothetical protein